MDFRSVCQREKNVLQISKEEQKELAYKFGVVKNKINNNPLEK